METESRFARQGLGRQMGFDGSWSEFEAWIDHPQLRRPDSYLADWDHAELTFWHFLEHEKAYGCVMGVHCTFARCIDVLMAISDFHIFE